MRNIPQGCALGCHGAAPLGLNAETHLLAVRAGIRRKRLFNVRSDATDRRIGALVYQLYGLSDEEIRIVEEATTK